MHTSLQDTGVGREVGARRFKAEAECYDITRWLATCLLADRPLAPRPAFSDALDDGAEASRSGSPGGDPLRDAGAGPDEQRLSRRCASPAGGRVSGRALNLCSTVPGQPASARKSRPVGEGVSTCWVSASDG